MRVTVFDLDGQEVVYRQAERPAWEPFEEWQGEELTDVHLVTVVDDEEATLQLVRIAAGGHFVMHATPDIAHCQIVEGRGTLRLPDGDDLRFEGPELYVFLPNTLHEWRDIEEDTLLSVCIVHPPANS